MVSEKPSSEIQIITLTTDFGESDGYVGTMWGVILGIAPGARVVNLSHQVPPQDIRAGAFVLYVTTPFFPPGTIHVVVVDPGVGSDRRALAVRTGRGIYVAPDNGVLSYVLAYEDVEEAVSLTNPRYHLPEVTATFHGRDVFAPVAAHVANGVPLSKLGPRAINLSTIGVPRPTQLEDGSLEAHVMHIDRFGNLILDVRDTDIEDEPSFEVRGEVIPCLSETFADVRRGELLAYVGSGRGHLEIAARDGSAAKLLKARVGDGVLLRF